MHGLSEHWAPYLVSNLVGVALVALAFRRPKLARWGFAILFAGASIVNATLALRAPRDYVEGYARFATPAYKAFIEGAFSAHVTPIVLSLALGQLLVAGMLARGGRWLTRGAVAAAVFLVAISPLGVGAAFPSTLFMALAVAVTAMQLDERISAVAWDVPAP